MFTLIKALKALFKYVPIVEAKFVDSSITVIGIYRPHSDTVNNFIELLNSVISYPYLAGRNCKILEDLNMNIADDTGPS